MVKIISNKLFMKEVSDMIKKITCIAFLAITILLIFAFYDINKINNSSQGNENVSSTSVNSFDIYQTSPQIQITEDVQEDSDSKLYLNLEQPKDINDRMGFVPQNY